MPSYAALSENRGAILIGLVATHYIGFTVSLDKAISSRKGDKQSVGGALQHAIPGNKFVDHLFPIKSRHRTSPEKDPFFEWRRK